MRCLTLHRPWAWCVVHGPKRVENRSWKAPASLLNQRFAIHAGKHWSDADAAIITLTGLVVPPQAEHPAMAIIGVATLLDCVKTAHGVTSVLGPDQVIWKMDGSWGWCLAEMIPLSSPIPHRGMQGLPNLPPETADEVMRRAGLVP